VVVCCICCMCWCGFGWAIEVSFVFFCGVRCCIVCVLCARFFVFVDCWCLVAMMLVVFCVCF